MTAPEEMDLSIQLVLELREILYPHFKIGPAESLRLKRAITFYDFKSTAEMLARASLLVPIIAKSAAEQDLFSDLMAKARIAAVKMPEPGPSGEPNVPEPVKPWLGRYELMLSIAALIIVLIYTLIWNPKGHHKENIAAVQLKKPDTSAYADSGYIYQGAISPPNIPVVSPLHIYHYGPSANAPLEWVFGALFSLIVSILLLVVVIDFGRMAYRRKIAGFKEKYQGPKTLGWPHVFIWPELRDQVFFNEAADALLLAFPLEKNTDFQKINFQQTIYQTIRNAGFVKFVYAPRLVQSDGIFLADLGDGNDQLAACIETFVYHYRKRGLSCEIYYYRKNPGKLSREKEMGDVITFEQLTEKYKGATLVIIGDGYGFLPDFKPGAVPARPLLDLLGLWKAAVLFSVVPRANWSSFERELYKAMAVCPATEEGFKFFGRSLLPSGGMVKLYPRDPSEEYQVFPAEGSIRAYEAYFKDPKMVYWLCCLALSDQFSLPVTIAVGKELESRFSTGGRLVTIFSLLKITSVKWLQNGRLNDRHRKELLQYLSDSPDGAEMKKATFHALKKLLRYVSVEKGSLLELDREIKLTVYEQWADEKGSLETAFLYRHNLLDNFSRGEFERQGKIRPLSFFKTYRAVLLTTCVLFAALLAFTLVSFTGMRRMLERIAGMTPAPDSLSYFNNRAVDALIRNKDKDPVGYQKEVALLFTRAEKYGRNNDTLELNRHIADYFAGNYYYRQHDVSSALRSFSHIAAQTDSAGLYACLGKSACFFVQRRSDSACYWESEFTDRNLSRHIKLLQALSVDPCNYRFADTISPKDTSKRDTSLVRHKRKPLKRVKPAGSAGPATSFQKGDPYKKQDPGRKPIPPFDSQPLNNPVNPDTTRSYSLAAQIYYGGLQVTGIAVLNNRNERYLVTVIPATRIRAGAPVTAGENTTIDMAQPIGIISVIDSADQVAVVKLNPGISFENSFPKGNSFRYVRDASGCKPGERLHFYSDSYDAQEVQFLSAKAINSRFRGSFQTNTEELIETSLANGKTGFLTDEDDRILGILISSGSDRSYFFPMSRIFERYNFRLAAISAAGK